MGGSGFRVNLVNGSDLVPQSAKFLLWQVGSRAEGVGV